MIREEMEQIAKAVSTLNFSDWKKLRMVVDAKFQIKASESQRTIRLAGSDEIMIENTTEGARTAINELLAACRPVYEFLNTHYEGGLVRVLIDGDGIHVLDQRMNVPTCKIPYLNIGADK